METRTLNNGICEDKNNRKKTKQNKNKNKTKNNKTKQNKTKQNKNKTKKKQQQQQHDFLAVANLPFYPQIYNNLMTSLRHFEALFLDVTSDGLNNF